MMSVLKNKLFILFSILIIVVVGLFSLVLLNRSNNQKTSRTTPSPTEIPINYPKQTIRKGGGLESETFQKWNHDFINSHPILQKLPANNFFFEIEYINENHLIVHPKTEDKQRAYQEAKAWFVLNGIDTTKIQVDYK